MTQFISLFTIWAQIWAVFCKNKLSVNVFTKYLTFFVLTALKQLECYLKHHKRLSLIMPSSYSRVTLRYSRRVIPFGAISWHSLRKNIPSSLRVKSVAVPHYMKWRQINVFSQRSCLQCSSNIFRGNRRTAGRLNKSVLRT